MFIENRLAHLAMRLKHSQPTPLRLSLCDGRSLDFGPDPKVTIVVPQKRTLRCLLPPDLMKLGEAYVEHWAANIERNRAEAVRIAGERRYRICSIYLAGCAFGFVRDWMNVYQVLAVKARRPNPLPLTRDWIYCQSGSAAMPESQA